jgi:hypothetical protein
VLTVLPEQRFATVRDAPVVTAHRICRRTGCPTRRSPPLPGLRGVLPSHRVLHGDVEVPEGIGLRHQDAASDERVGAGEDDQELDDVRGTDRCRVRSRR